MPLTPADVHNVVFKKPPIGKRGYDEDEVDAFLDVVEAELARLIEENNELRATGGRAAPASRSARPRRPLRLSGCGRRSSQPARTTAPDVPDAGPWRPRPRTLRQRGQDPGRADAHRRQDQQRPPDEADARTKSEQMVAEAKHRGRLDGQRRPDPGRDDGARVARQGRRALEQDAERRHPEAMSASRRKRTSLERKIEELRTFEREYRTRLQGPTSSRTCATSTAAGRPSRRLTRTGRTSTPAPEAAPGASQRGADRGAESS